MTTIQLENQLRGWGWQAIGRRGHRIWMSPLGHQLRVRQLGMGAFASGHLVARALRYQVQVETGRALL